MMIKCVKCGFENQMGAIFCRQCGEKIDMNAISPESLESGKVKENAKKKALSAIRWTVRIVVLVVILGGAAAAFAPWGLPTYVAPDENSADFKKKEETAMAKLKLFAGEKGPRVPVNAEITIDELNVLFFKYFLKPGENKTSSWTLDHIVFAPEGDRLTMQVYAKMFGKVPVVFQTVGMPEVKDDSFACRIDSAKLGHLPLFFCNKVAARKIEKFFEDDELERLFKRTSSITPGRNSLIFHIRGSQGKPESVAEKAEEAVEEVVEAAEEKAEKAVKKLRKKSGKKKASKD